MLIGHSRNLCRSRHDSSCPAFVRGRFFRPIRWPEIRHFGAHLIAPKTASSSATGTASSVPSYPVAGVAARIVLDANGDSRHPPIRPLVSPGTNQYEPKPFLRVAYGCYSCRNHSFMTPLPSQRAARNRRSPESPAPTTLPPARRSLLEDLPSRPGR